MNKLFALLSLLLCFACSNQVEFKRIDAEFKHRYNLTDAPGAAIIIAKGDSILYEQYAGVADAGLRGGCEYVFHGRSIFKACQGSL